MRDGTYFGIYLPTKQKCLVKVVDNRISKVIVDDSGFFLIDNEDENTYTPEKVVIFKSEEINNTEASGD